MADALEQAEALAAVPAAAAAAASASPGWRGGSASGVTAAIGPNGTTSGAIGPKGTGGVTSASGATGPNGTNDVAGEKAPPPPSLGVERTEYLVGLLRALPVSEEGVSSLEEAASAAAKVEASAGALASALELGGREERGSGDGGGAGVAPRDPDELDDLVKTVQAVLGGPDEQGGLGEGFVEACLSVLGWAPQVRVGAFYLVRRVLLPQSW